MPLLVAATNGGAPGGACANYTIKSPLRQEFLCILTNKKLLTNFDFYDIIKLPNNDVEHTHTKRKRWGEMKKICNAIAVLFCMLTLGFVDLTIIYSDRTQFKWIGWISRIIQRR